MPDDPKYEPPEWLWVFVVGVLLLGGVFGYFIGLDRVDEPKSERFDSEHIRLLRNTGKLERDLNSCRYSLSDEESSVSELEESVSKLEEELEDTASWEEDLRSCRYDLRSCKYSLQSCKNW